tara:strand:+ start:2086 stop:2283 length:198 start_codon:yes stop_codon:yes gene_type:complete
MDYETVQRESDNFIKFYVAFRESDDVTFEVPCVLNDEGEVDEVATQEVMDQHIINSDILMSYIKE